MNPAKQALPLPRAPSHPCPGQSPSPSSPRPQPGHIHPLLLPQALISLSCLSSSTPPQYSSPALLLPLSRNNYITIAVARTWFPFTEIHMQMSQIPHASRFVSTILDTRNPSYTRFPLTMCANNIIISSPRPCSTPTLLMLIRAHSPHP